MFKTKMIVALTVLTSVLSAAANAAPLQCKSQNSQEPNVSVGFYSNGNVIVDGVSAAPGDDTKTQAINCFGQRVDTDSQSHRAQTYFYYELHQTATCPWDYARVTKNPVNGVTYFVLVNRSAADNHDWSGYAYDQYACQQ